MAPRLPLPTNVGHAPRAPLVRVLFCATLAIIIAATGLELTWRALGYKPSVSDSRELWSYYRQTVYHPSRRVIVLLGTSRMQCGVVTDLLRREFPRYRVVELATAGVGSPAGTLEHLAGDDAFAGVVICEMLAPFLLHRRWESQRGRYGTDVRFSQRVNAVLAGQCESRLAMLSPVLSIGSLTSSLADTASLPRQSTLRVRPDRSIVIDPSKSKRQTPNPIDGWSEAAGPSELRKDFLIGLSRLANAVYRIQSRGGSVIFVHLPSGPAIRASEDETFPRKDYWNLIVARSGAVCIDDKALDAAGDYKTADGQHMDSRVATVFTMDLVKNLRTLAALQ